MELFDEKNWKCFLDCVNDLLVSDEVRSMQAIPHHPGVNCYEHSVFVAYVAFRLARRWGVDYVAAARGGLLHDLYLYDSRDHSKYEGNQCFAHPKAAAKNAAELCGGLSAKEENIIISHMWPLARRCPATGRATWSTWPTSSAPPPRSPACGTGRGTGCWPWRRGCHFGFLPQQKTPPLVVRRGVF